MFTATAAPWSYRFVAPEAPPAECLDAVREGLVDSEPQARS